MARLIQLQFVVKLSFVSSILLYYCPSTPLFLVDATGATKSCSRSSSIISTGFVVVPPALRILLEKPNLNLKSKLDVRTNNLNTDERKQRMIIYDKNNTRNKTDRQDNHNACLTNRKITSTPENKERTMKQRVVRGLITAPLLITTPFYAIGFGLVGYNKMWIISEWFYGFSKPTERYVHKHFDGIQNFLRKPDKKSSNGDNNVGIHNQDKVKKRRTLGYVIHPTFAGLSLMTTSVLAFLSPFKIATIIGINYQQLLLTNLLICIISTVAAIPLKKTMIGNCNAKKWNTIQGNLAVIFAALSLLQGNVGGLFVHLNWSILFAGGVLERLYVLCILSQINTPNKKTYVKYYSPQIKIATLGSIPIGLVTYIFSL